MPTNTTGANIALRYVVIPNPYTLPEFYNRVIFFDTPSKTWVFETGKNVHWLFPAQVDMLVAEGYTEVHRIDPEKKYKFRGDGVKIQMPGYGIALFPEKTPVFEFYDSDDSCGWNCWESGIGFSEGTFQDMLSRGLLEEVAEPPHFPDWVRGRLEWDNADSPNPRVIFVPDIDGMYQIAPLNVLMGEARWQGSILGALDVAKMPESLKNLEKSYSNSYLEQLSKIGQLPDSLEQLYRWQGETFDKPAEGDIIRQEKIVPDEAQAAYLESLQENRAVNPEIEDGALPGEKEGVLRPAPGTVETGHLTEKNDFIATPESHQAELREKISCENWRAWEGTPKPIEEILKCCGAGEVHITEGKRTFLAYRYFNGTRESAELIWQPKPEYHMMVPLTDEPELNIYKLKWPLMQTDAFIFPGSWLIQESSEAGWELYTPERALEIFGLYFIQNAQ